GRRYGGHVGGARPPEATDKPPRGAANAVSVGVVHPSGARPPEATDDPPRGAANAVSVAAVPWPESTPEHSSRSDSAVAISPALPADYLGVTRQLARCERPTTGRLGDIGPIPRRPMIGSSHRLLSHRPNQGEPDACIHHRRARPRQPPGTALPALQQRFKPAVARPHHAAGRAPRRAHARPHRLRGAGTMARWRAGVAR